MILSRVQIENYKQYVGSHDIEFPQDALVGVIGDNGTGKTTLFEAVEWCLYSPRAISPSDVRPRGMSGNTTVTVYLETSGGSDQFVVQRVLRRTPSASIFRIDQSGEMHKVVDGTRQVSDYVANTLIGLSHSAFTASFFTRQKELHLFGSETPAKRREAIGRMLGLETIRQARRSIMDDRQRSLAEARAIRTQYERESAGRDFALEVDSAQSTITAREADVVAATQSLSATASAATNAEATFASTLERRDRHATITRDMAMHERERNACVDRITQLERELEQVARRETERSALAATAERYGALKAELDRQDGERVRHELRTTLERTRSEIVNRRRHVIDGIAVTVSSISPREPIDGWIWSHNDDIAPTDGLTRLLAIVDGLDIAAAEQRETNLRRCVDAAQAVTDAEAVLQRYHERRQILLDEEQAYLQHGEPGQLLPSLEREREELLARKTTLEANVTRLGGERDQSRILLNNLRQQQFGDLCPTCGRPFAPGDAEIVIAAIESRVATIGNAITEAGEAVQSATRKIQEIERLRASTGKLQQDLDSVRARVASGATFIEEQEGIVRTRLEERATALRNAGLNDPPPLEAIRRSQSNVRDLQGISRTRKALSKASGDLVTLRDQETEVVTQLAPLTGIRFDPSGFARLQGDTHAADRARAEVTQIDHEISRRPAMQTDLATHTTRRDALSGELARSSRDLAELGFDPTETTLAQRAVDQAKADAQKAQDHYHQVRALLREAEMHRDQVIRERDRLKDLATLSDQRQREADEFDLMSKEFMEFERFAGERKVPILNDTTSSLVEAITDGKYQRVEFDQDFGIKVFETGDIEESFPIDTFSGGERDAIILAARLALSRMIGQQAANPPGFLVLDEVFGSLDADRRAHLLGLLGTITSLFDDVRQVFIISHVDDVRTSSVLDEVWRVEENADGGRQVTVLGAGSDLDE